MPPEPLSRQSNGLVPVRATLYLTAAVPESAWESGEFWDALEAAVSQLHGVYHEGGSAELMAGGDVVEGSPLDSFLRGGQGAS